MALRRRGGVQAEPWLGRRPGEEAWGQGQGCRAACWTPDPQLLPHAVLAPHLPHCGPQSSQPRPQGLGVGGWLTAGAHVDTAQVLLQVQHTLRSLEPVRAGGQWRAALAAPGTALAHCLPLHKDVANAATEVAEGARLRQAPQQEPGGAIGRGLRPWGRSLVQFRLLQLVVHVEREPGGRRVGSPACPPLGPSPRETEARRRGRQVCSPRGVAVEGHVVAGSVSEDPWRFHLRSQKMKHHVAPLQGHLAEPVLQTVAR